MASDVRQFRKRLEAEGYVLVQRPGSNHIKVYRAGSKRLLGILASSPSDHRTLLNCYRDIKRAERQAGVVTA